MNYKSLIKKRENRLKILRLLDFIPDRIMLKIQYKISLGRPLNLKNPERYTEKIQRYKLFYRKELMTQCADKYKVRDYISQKGLDNILIPLYGVYDNANKIDFSTLPNEFVLKTNNGSKTNIICDDLEALDVASTKNQLNSWLDKRITKAGREWPYYNIEPKIICEKLLKEENGLTDYKFMCFRGEVAYIFVNQERRNENLNFSIFDKKFRKQNYKRKGLKEINSSFSKPENFEEMVKIAERLSEDFPHVRVDLYNIEGKIYFGELTFFHGSGYVQFEPDEFDYILGGYFKEL